jgi:Signal peptidase subunit
MTPEYAVKDLKVARIFTMRPQDEEARNGRKVKRDRVLLELDLDADLSGLFNWNVKQLFVFIKATWETKTNSHNEQIIWDRIIQSPQDALLKLNASSPKYLVIDQKAGEIRGKALNISIHWDVMPYTGLLLLGGASSGPLYDGFGKDKDIASPAKRHYYSLRLPENPCGFGQNGSQDPCSFEEIQPFEPFITSGFIPYDERPEVMKPKPPTGFLGLGGGSWGEL